MQTVRVNSTKKYLLIFFIFAIVLFIYPLYTTAEIRIFTHVEENDSYLLPAETPRMVTLRVYDDGTAVARIVRKNSTTTVNDKNYILVTYVETTNPDDPSTYEDWGM